MHVKNVNLQHLNRHNELFVPSRPYRGEPPTVAGFLLYPDTPAKMETTSQEAFCFRPVPQQDGGKGGHVAQHTQQVSHWSHSTPSRQTGGGNSSKETEQVEDKQQEKRVQRGSTAAKMIQQDATEMRSQYQRDFPPLSSCRRRRTPALPQPDNIGINLAFGFEFNTVQREAYPGWSITNPRVASFGKPSMTSERLFITGCKLTSEH